MILPIGGGGGGTPGTNGATWRTGSGAPSGALGVVNDLYLDTDNGDYYKKTGGSTYTLQGNLTGPPYSNYTVIPGAGSSATGFFSNVTLDLSAGGIVLPDATFIGNGETLVFPAGYSPGSGKTYINGVSSNFPYNLDLGDPTIYDASGGGGVGELTIPAGLKFIGKFIFINGYVTCQLIQGLDSWCGAVEFTVDDPANGVLLSTLTPATMTTAGECVTDLYSGGAAIGIYSFDFTGAPYGYCKLIKGGSYNLVTERVGY